MSCDPRLGPDMVLPDANTRRALRTLQALVHRGVLSPEDADTVRREFVFTPEQPVYLVLTSEPGPAAWVTEPQLDMSTHKRLTQLIATMSYNEGHKAGFDAGYAIGKAWGKEPSCGGGEGCCGRHH